MCTYVNSPSENHLNLWSLVSLMIGVAREKFFSFEPTPSARAQWLHRPNVGSPTARLLAHAPRPIHPARRARRISHGETYLDDGVTCAHKDAHPAWRGLSVEGGAELRLSNVDLAAATPRSAVEGGAIATFDRQNPFQSGIRVRVFFFLDKRFIR
jgi:hypothetical protein